MDPLATQYAAWSHIPRMMCTVSNTNSFPILNIHLLHKFDVGWWRWCNYIIHWSTLCTDFLHHSLSAFQCCPDAFTGSIIKHRILSVLNYCGRFEQFYLSISLKNYDYFHLSLPSWNTFDRYIYTWLILWWYCKMLHCTIYFYNLVQGIDAPPEARAPTGHWLYGWENLSS